MRLIVGIDDTDSALGGCTTHLAYRIAVDLRQQLEVLAYPKLVRLNPNVPFKTRGNAAVCLHVEADDPRAAYELISEKVRGLADVGGGANSGVVFLDDLSVARSFEPLYRAALAGVVSHHRVRRFLREAGARSLELGNGMGLVGAAAAIGFDEGSDHTYELIAYRLRENCGVPRAVDSSSVKEMDAKTFPHTFNNYDHQKRKVLIAPHGPDPVFVGVRGDTPETVMKAFSLLRYNEPLAGHMVFVSNQHTDAHLEVELDWKVYSSGWARGTVEEVRVGQGGHVYLSLRAGGETRLAAAYEPTGDLRRTVRLLRPGDQVNASGGVRRGTSRHAKVLNLEKVEVLSSGSGLPRGSYISSPRANRHLTKPLIRYGREARGRAEEVVGWLAAEAMRPKAPA